MTRASGIVHFGRAWVVAMEGTSFWKPNLFICGDVCIDYDRKEVLIQGRLVQGGTRSSRSFAYWPSTRTSRIRAAGFGPSFGQRIGFAIPRRSHPPPAQ